MLHALLPKSAKRVVLYLQPFNLRLGPEKLATFCRDIIRIEPDDKTCFMFVNRKRDTMLMYFLGHDGGQTLTKKLDRGSFLLPAPSEDATSFVVLRPSALPRLFRA
jgi:hypothetical protein